jgi:murein tripeptide amidase MpaA
MTYIPQRWIAEDPTYRPDRYFRYDQITSLLRDWEAGHPGLVSMASIGKTFEGRDIWSLTITDRTTGSHDTKPAYFVDANIHAGEVTGCSTVLWLVNHLLTNQGDETIRRLLRETTLYVVPALSIDGMERILEGRSSRIRSSVRPFPEPDQQDGLVREDLDGNGLVSHMRVRDPNGPWKVSTDDARLMVRRGPDEVGGEYYFVLPEGRIQEWDGGAIALAPDLMGLDINRNFPLDWAPYWEQPGSGSYPLSEPETRALADFLLAHPNIHGSQHFHTWSAAILRPSARYADEEMPKPDLNIFKAIGELGTEETGYPCISVFHDFAYDKKKPIRGVAMDWIYEQVGAFPFSTELWSLPRKAGIEVKDFIEFMRKREDSVDVAMLKVLDEHVDGAGYKPWEPFEHPQLGPVEIGGWDYTFTWQNPPGPLLEEVTSGNARFVIRAMGTAPRIVIEQPTAEPIGDGLYKVSVIVQNTGFLPTNVSEKAKTSGVAKPVKVDITLNDADGLVSGKQEQDLGHLSGRSSQYEAMTYMAGYGNTSRARAEWIVQQEPGSTATVRATSSKAGSQSLDITLPPAADGTS